MLRFYWPTFRRSFGILWTATDRYVTAVGIGAASVTFFNPELARLPWIDWPTLSRWWAILPLLALFAYGFLKALHERFGKVEEQLATVKDRRAVKGLLANAVDRGKTLQRSTYKDGDEIKLVSKQDVEDWVHYTHDLIETAFDKGEARHFLNSEGYDPGHKLPFRDARHDPYKYYIEPRLKRLDELLVRANSLEINPDFDPHSVIQPVEESTAERLRLETAVEQRNEENEKLTEEREQLTTERDALQEESQRLRAERDAQLRVRCFYLSESLRQFLKDWSQEGQEQEIMDEYRQRFSGEVTAIINDLKQVEWWDSEGRERLEFPENQQDIERLAYYIRDFGFGRL